MTRHLLASALLAVALPSAASAAGPSWGPVTELPVRGFTYATVAAGPSGQVVLAGTLGGHPALA